MRTDWVDKKAPGVEHLRSAELREPVGWRRQDVLSSVPPRMCGRGHPHITGGNPSPDLSVVRSLTLRR